MHYTMFSIIISTHLRPSLLKRALESIKFQHSPHQIIVVSDVFCTETYEVCNNILTSTDCLIIAKNIKGPSESRNLENELYFKVDFGKYSALNKVEISLEEIMA